MKPSITPRLLNLYVSFIVTGSHVIAKETIREQRVAVVIVVMHAANITVLKTTTNGTQLHICNGNIYLIYEILFTFFTLNFLDSYSVEYLVVSQISIG